MISQGNTNIMIRMGKGGGERRGGGREKKEDNARNVSYIPGN